MSHVSPCRPAFGCAAGAGRAAYDGVPSSECEWSSRGARKWPTTAGCSGVRLKSVSVLLLLGCGGAFGPLPKFDGGGGSAGGGGGGSGAGGGIVVDGLPLKSACSTLNDMRCK